jgi:hypothetical protein
MLTSSPAGPSVPPVLDVTGADEDEVTWEEVEDEPPDVPVKKSRAALAFEQALSDVSPAWS